ncbi:MAG: helix-turn-helix domain-containing protein [Cuniculiplasma sp.]
MLSGNFSISSKCSLAEAAGSMNETIISTYVYPIDATKNYVCSVLNKPKSEELQQILSHDYISYNLYSRDGITLLQGIKRGHGIMKAIIDSGCVPTLPIKATDGVETLTFMAFNSSAVTKLQELLQDHNSLENFDYERMSGNELFSELTRRWGIIGSMNLTDTERSLIRSAYSMGFFNWPRAYDLGSMKEDYKLSKPTLLFHLRNAERKILKTIFD